MCEAGSDFAKPTTRQNGSVTLVVLPRPSTGDSNEPVSSDADVIVALGGGNLVRSLQLAAIPGMVRVARQANDTISAATHFIMSFTLFVGQEPVTKTIMT
jgi:hypothetical protein